MPVSALLAATSSAATPTIPSSHAVLSPVARDRRTAQLFAEADQAGDDRARRACLDEVVVLNMSVAHAVASRYRNRGIGSDDLGQVACLALVKAVRRFDPAHGSDFLCYALPTIRGEVKRHFRDVGWTVRPPRRIQELQPRLSAADSELSLRLGRRPRPSELAAHLEVEPDDVIEALASEGCFAPSSLDRPVGVDGSASVGDLLGREDQSTQAVEARTVLAPAVKALGQRDRRILMLRFFRGWTQSEIAADIGVTQMQVSRLLTRIMRDLRTDLEARGMHCSS